MRYAYCAFLAALVITLSAAFQPANSYNDGLGWDGAQYTQLAGQCGRTPMQAMEPFVYRIGAPCLAALLPLAPRQGLFAVNLVASVLLVFLMEAWLRRHVAAHLVPWLVAGFAFHWLAPLRHVWWYPTHIEPLAYCAIVGALLTAGRPRFFAAVCFAGALVRETMLLVPAALLAGHLISEWRQRPGRPRVQGWLRNNTPARAALAGLLAAVAAVAMTRWLVTPSTDYWMADSAYYWAYQKPLPRYLLGIFITYGPAVMLVPLGWPHVTRGLTRFPEFAVLLGGVLVLAWVGGSDTERFLLWGSPVVLVLIGWAAEHIRWERLKAPLAVLLVAQALNGRWMWRVPNHWDEAPRAWPVLTPINAQSSALLFSQTPDQLMSAVALAQYAALALVMYAWLRRRGSQART